MGHLLAGISKVKRQHFSTIYVAAKAQDGQYYHSKSLQVGFE